MIVNLFPNTGVSTTALSVAVAAVCVAAPLRPAHTEEPPAAIQAAAPVGPAISLAEARRQALAHNWDLLAARSDVDFATAQRLVAKEFPNPTLAASVSKISVDGTSDSTSMGNGFFGRSYDTIMAVNQLLEIGGKRFSRKASAAAGLDAASARFNDARRLLDQGVTRAYVAALLAETNAAILRNSVQTLRQEAELAAVRVKAGDLSVADQRQIEIAADQQDIDARSAETAALQARIALEVLLGVKEAKGALRAADSLASLEGPPAPEVPTQIAARPDVVAAEAALRKAEADLKLQKANRVPDPTFTVQYEREPPDKPNTIGIGISLPLPLWNHNRGAIQAAEATRDQAATWAEKARAQAQADLASAQAAYADARERWQRYRDDVRPKAAEVYAIIAYAYRQGGKSVLDLLLAQRNDNDIRLAASQAQAALVSALADLESARTVMTEMHPSHQP